MTTRLPASDSHPDTPGIELRSHSGLCAALTAHGALGRLRHDGISINLFVGNPMEGGPANLFLRRHDDAGRVDCTPLLGPHAPLCWQDVAHSARAAGTWRGLRCNLALVLADNAPAWFWHLQVHNAGDAAQTIDVIHAQDLALAPDAAIRLNEYYVSQYIDHAPLAHAAHGHVVASRQNQAVAGRHPWCVMGSLRRAVAFAPDALQVHGLAARAGERLPGIDGGLPARRLQHEHAMVALQDQAVTLAPGESVRFGFFGWLEPDHPAATSAADLALVDRALALAAASAPQFDAVRAAAPAAPAAPAALLSLFASAPVLGVSDLDDATLDGRIGVERRHEERDGRGRLLSFFHDSDRHVVLRAKELQVLRPHGHLLRSGGRRTPDETALTSTVWMAGVFHSMLTQGHVGINRVLSTVRSTLGFFRSQGQRVFVGLDGGWHLLDQPSAFEMRPLACRWLYRHAGGLIEVSSLTGDAANEMRLQIDVVEGAPLRCLISNHVAWGGDDGSAPRPVQWWRDAGGGIALSPPPASELHDRFPQGRFELLPAAGTVLEAVGGDEMLWPDGAARGEPYLCLVTAPARTVGLTWRGGLVASSALPDVPPAREPLRWGAPAGSPLGPALERLADILPWYAHNAAVHYLSPRGLEQFSGGGWGTRDVCQGPVELLLAGGETAPVRDLLLRVFANQNVDGDWPQWFMFFERERAIRAGDSHGDIVFWPLLALAQYLIATHDASILDERLPYWRPRPAAGGPGASVWGHVRLALRLIRRRVITGTALAAYGHGDWNDALQPADPALREHLCSAWTVTLHHQTLTTLARALGRIGRTADAAPLARRAAAVKRDFRRVLMADGVLAGYAHFEADGSVRHLLHPRDERTGVRLSALAMIHAILEDLLDPDEARAHLALLRGPLSGPDGVRLFDRPLAYHGGPQRLFQRAESASFFGREIGLMYMHAHLRYAQALAHVGDAEGFFRALCQANPIGLQALVPTASRRQSNCYFSSSDAAFADRHEASAHYERVAQGEVALDGGWRVYSSGAGIAVGLIVRRLLGLELEADDWRLDPVLPPALDGLRVTASLAGRAVELVYRVEGAGCGVTQVLFDGNAVPLRHEPNPYRPGAVRIARAALAAAVCNGRALLVEVRLGALGPAPVHPAF